MLVGSRYGSVALPVELATVCVCSCWHVAGWEGGLGMGNLRQKVSIFGVFFSVVFMSVMNELKMC